ncbi:MAG: universal stress protein [Cyclobacteriaceae bacterium]|nr:universal stress protein [Cyclobacteriaceae bacterium]
MYRKIGLALAFSPTFNALMAEAVRLKHAFKAELVLIHVGIKNPEKEEGFMELLQRYHLKPAEVTIIWRQGKAAKTIIKTCKKENVDLLIAGALKHENLIDYYIGSIARKILRKAPCSILILTEPSEKGRKIQDMVVDVDEDPLRAEVIRSGLAMAVLQKPRIIHFVKEIKLYGLTMSVMSEYSIEETSVLRKNLIYKEIKKVEKVLDEFDMGATRTNIKIISGKSGFELRKFARQVKADLLVMGAVKKKLDIIDRLFTNKLEYIIEDIPCNLLLIKHKQANER